jgi:hypothetical protein
VKTPPSAPPGLVPPGFVPPTGLRTDDFVLEPLDPRHNAADHRAWSTSIDHIRATPGFDDPDDTWPVPMTLEENLRDLERHAEDFCTGRGFTYTVLDPHDGDVIGCVYVYPARDSAHDARVRSWVRVSHAALDAPLWRAARDWLASDAWPFERVADHPRAD